MENKPASLRVLSLGRIPPSWCGMDGWLATLKRASYCALIAFDDSANMTVLTRGGQLFQPTGHMWEDQVLPGPMNRSVPKSNEVKKKKKRSSLLSTS